MHLHDFYLDRTLLTVSIYALIRFVPFQVDDPLEGPKGLSITPSLHRKKSKYSENYDFSGIFEIL